LHLQTFRCSPFKTTPGLAAAGGAYTAARVKSQAQVKEERFKAPARWLGLVDKTEMPPRTAGAGTAPFLPSAERPATDFNGSYGQMMGYGRQK
jgi:hypothetical protein